MQDLKALMARSGKTVDEVASASGVSRSTLFRWRRGDIANPNPREVDAVAMVLHVDSDELRALIVGARGSLHRVDANGKNRRTLLVGGFGAAALADSLGLNDADPAQTQDELDMLGAGLEGQRLGEGSTRWIAAQVALLSRLDDEVGGTVVFPLARSSLRLANGLLKAGSVGSASERSFRLGLARLARLAAWTAQDSGLACDADRYYRLAIELARSEGDRDFAAYCMAMMGFQAVDSGLPAQCLSLLEAAAAAAAKDSPFQVVIAQWAVQPLGLLGRRKAAARSLVQADALWDAHKPDRVPDWLYWMWRPSLTPEVPRGFIGGDPVVAERLLTQGLRAVPAEFPRDRVLFLVGIAEALAAQGRLDEAVATAGEVTDVAQRIAIPRAETRLRELMAQLPADPVTSELRERVALLEAR